MSVSYGQRRSLARSGDRAARRYDAEAAAVLAEMKQAEQARATFRIALGAERDAAAPCDVASLRPGDFVRDRHGWHRVVRVSKSSVTVGTDWSWTELIPHHKIIETRSAELAVGGDR